MKKGFPPFVLGSDQATEPGFGESCRRSRLCTGQFTQWRDTSCTKAGASGGSGGIRTHGTVPRTLVFKTRALNHSATLPCPARSCVADGAGRHARQTPICTGWQVPVAEFPLSRPAITARPVAAHCRRAANPPLLCRAWRDTMHESRAAGRGTAAKQVRGLFLALLQRYGLPNAGVVRDHPCGGRTGATQTAQTERGFAW